MARPNPMVARRLRGFLPISEAARVYRIPRTTIVGWMKARRVRGVRVGYFLFVSRASMRAASKPREL